MFYFYLLHGVAEQAQDLTSAHKQKSHNQQPNYDSAEAKFGELHVCESNYPVHLLM